jgi:hypothetical protein
MHKLPFELKIGSILCSSKVCCPCADALDAALAAVGPFSGNDADNQGELVLLFDTIDLLLEHLGSKCFEEPGNADEHTVPNESRGGIMNSPADGHMRTCEGSGTENTLAECKACILWTLRALQKAAKKEQADIWCPAAAVIDFLAKRYFLFTERCGPEVWDAALQVTQHIDMRMIF